MVRSVRAALLSSLIVVGLGCATSPSPAPERSDQAPMEASAPAAAAGATPPVSDEVRARANEVLDAAVASEDKDLRSEGLIALGVSGREDAGPALTAALKDPDGHTRFAAARGLRYLGDPSVQEVIATAYRGEKGWAVRRELLVAAGALKLTSLLPDLKQALSDSRDEVRLAAAWALKDLGDPSADEALAKLGNPERKGVAKPGTDRWSRKVLRGEKDGDRLLAARTLAEVGTAEDVPLLATLLDAPDEVLRVVAAGAVLRLSRK